MKRGLLFLFGFILIFVIFLVGCKKNISKPPTRGPVWSVFTKANHADIIDDNIHTIFASSTDRVWFGTDSGALYYTTGIWGTIRDSLTYFIYGNGSVTKKQKVLAIAEGRQSAIWFGLDGGGVRRFNRYNPQGSWQRYSSDPINGIPSDFVTAIVADKYRNGDAWVATLTGVAQYTPINSVEGSWHPYSDYSEHFTSSLVRSITLNSANGWIFFGTHDGVPYVREDNGMQWGKINLSGAENLPVHSIAVDYSNTVWMGKTFGITRWSANTTQINHYYGSNTNNQLPNQKINAIAVDFFRPIRWFGTDIGLTRFQDTTWTFFDQTTIPELPSNQIQALAYDNKGNLWIGTNMGIVAYNPEGFEY